MMSDHPPILRVRRPEMAARLAAGGGAAPARPARAARPPAPPPRHQPEGKPVSLLKRLERYVSALFKLGRTAKLAKTASHAATVIEPRLDALAQDFYEFREEVGSGHAFGGDDGWGPRLERVEITARETRDRLAEFAVAPPRIAEVEGALERVEGKLDTAEGWLHTAEVRLDAMEGEIARARVRRKDFDEVAQRVSTLEERLREENAALRGQVADLTAKLDALTARVEGGEGHFKALEDAFRRHSEDAHGRLSAVERDLGDRLGGFERRVDRVVGDVAQAGRAYADLTRRLDLQRFRAGEAAADAAPPSEPPREGLEALMDAFYGRLEDRFRGSREEIKGRLTVYLDDIDRAMAATGALPALDLGCGRGEWVELLTESGYAARGIDLNPVQIAEAAAKGLAVEQGDALAALAAAPDNAYAAITAHHLIEHLPFETLTWMTREALRVLAPGGVLIYETPNCRNLIVGATTFNIDPTHKKPLPAELLSTLLDTVGYHPVEMRPLHPSETLEAFARDDRADPYLAELLFGPQDLAAIAIKPRIAA